MGKPSAALLLGVAGYLATLATIVLLLAWARQWAMDELARPDVQAQWQRWKAEETDRAEAAEGPVRRRPPKSDEPPLLVLLRDHFGGVLAGCLVLGSALYIFTAIVVQGVVRAGAKGASAGT